MGLRATCTMARLIHSTMVIQHTITLSPIITIPITMVKQAQDLVALIHHERLLTPMAQETGSNAGGRTVLLKIVGCVDCKYWDLV